MAEHTLNRLKEKQVANAPEGKRLPDGGGLWLSTIRGKSWVFVYTRDGKRREIGLGSCKGVTLKEARRLAAEARDTLKDGREPVSPRKAAKAKAEPAEAEAAPVTFGDYAETYISRVEGGWKSPVHRQQWRQSLRDHAAALQGKPLSDITTADVLAVLEPIWQAKPETASRVRGRIEKVLSAALAEGMIPRPYENPARWKDHLEHSLGGRKKLVRGHHAALPYEDAPAFMAALRKRSALAAQCLEFTILTAARSGEALGATWGEIDLDKELWTIPADRMKAKAEHRVPLSPAAIEILKELRPEKPKADAKVFAINGAARSNMAMAMLLRRMGRGDLTVHGFRSTFRDWAGDATGHAHQIIEAALAHTIQNKAEAAYRRRDALEKRRALMVEWADYLAKPSEGAAA